MERIRSLDGNGCQAVHHGRPAELAAVGGYVQGRRTAGGRIVEDIAVFIGKEIRQRKAEGFSLLVEDYVLKVLGQFGAVVLQDGVSNHYLGRSIIGILGDDFAGISAGVGLGALNLEREASVGILAPGLCIRSGCMVNRKRVTVGIGNRERDGFGFRSTDTKVGNLSSRRNDRRIVASSFNGKGC